MHREEEEAKKKRAEYETARLYAEFPDPEGEKSKDGVSGPKKGSRMASSSRGQSGIQQLLAAEQEAKQIVDAAKNEKLARLKYAKDEVEKEIAEHRAQLEYEFQKKVSEGGILNMLVVLLYLLLVHKGGAFRRQWEDGHSNFFFI
ncbi:hypothetical protein PIB30_042182 [Stylosanthes scabra]|uniref:V-type proton ATPase subunit G n=1 Tax=Stylosanthes scabra TaxID=79078 RepID=A0ABU6TH83_9FABA|nr:hypothetical protein [Stylosanthes scabra]